MPLVLDGEQQEILGLLFASGPMNSNLQRGVREQPTIGC